MKVRKRESGVYMTEFQYIHPMTGKKTRFRRSTGLKKKAEALELAMRWKRELETPPKPATEKKKKAAFSGFAKHWIDIHAANLKPATLDSYTTILRVHLVPEFRNADLRVLSVEQVEAFKAKKLKAGLSAKSINNYLGVGGRLYRSAIDWGYADTNPFWRAGRLKEAPTETQFWDREQSDAFLATVREVEPKWYAFFLTALRTGMRQGELFGLQWGDLDFVKKRIRIQRALRKRVVNTPKNNKFRTVPMTQQVHDALLAHRSLRSREWVFTRNDGRPLTRNAIKWAFWRLTRAAGLPEIRFHDLRHSFASQLVMAGVPLAGVKELLGHADIKMTMRYSHLSQSETGRYVTALEDEGWNSPSRHDSENRARFGHVRDFEGSTPLREVR